MEAASIAQHCKTLRLSSIGTQFASLADEACQQNHSHLHYLEALLQAEVEDRERRSIELRLKDAHLPRMKTLEEFDFALSPHIPASRSLLPRAPAEAPPSTARWEASRQLRSRGCRCAISLHSGRPHACAERQPLSDVPAHGGRSAV